MQSYHPGFDIHWIQANRAGKTPWGWRSGVVRSYDELVAVIDYVDKPASITIWHSRDLFLTLGTPVRVHEQYHVLEACRTWFSYDQRGGGLGAVPEPEHPELWEPEVAIPLTEIGVGISYLDDLP